MVAPTFQLNSMQPRASAKHQEHIEILRAKGRPLRRPLKFYRVLHADAILIPNDKSGSAVRAHPASHRARHGSCFACTQCLRDLCRPPGTVSRFHHRRLRCFPAQRSASGSRACPLRCSRQTERYSRRPRRVKALSG